ncbi:hypothetical protein BCR33DRAFT_721932 [Rhizoclosmatium globosum]|uniref:Uncharacterized protein n=1 Tax=Rhizoclosmatium globosum TaxID=329046 RepID=A0A1Y2BPP4_9FUNG|nr:hypothetical protein BCR33DRAFT_721932 [Rhizoclosmatium globosum]|eukprot:ORY36719.1 hypothetical protein BCR33DRAFT_721932 [Rhizoclosmatium globosum]
MVVDTLRCLGAHRLLAPEVSEITNTFWCVVDASAAAVEAYFIGHHRLGLVSFECEEGPPAHVTFTTITSNQPTHRLVSLKDDLNNSVKSEPNGLPGNCSFGDLVLTLDASRRRKIDVLLDGGLGAYGHVVHLMAICTLGQSYLAANNTLSAQECFTLAADQINHKLYQPPSLNTITHPELRKLAQSPEFSDQYLAWTEESLYSQIAVAAPETIAKLTRQYTLYFAQAATPSFRLKKSHSSQALPHIPCQHCRTPSTKEIQSSLEPHFRLFCISLLRPSSHTNNLPSQIPQQVLAEFQNMQFPRLAGDGDEETLKLEALRHARVVEMFEWTALVEVSSNSLESGGGVWESVEKGTAHKHTFENLKVLRHLSHAFASLLAHLCDSACDAEVQEALLAFAAYVKLYTRRRSEAITDAKKHHTSFNGSVIENEKVSDVVGVLINSVRVCLAWWRGDDALLETAKSYIDFALTLTLESDPTNKHLLHHVYRYKGIVYGELAMKSQFQQTAIESFKLSLEYRVPGDDGRGDWQLYYQLALQYGEAGDVAEAVSAVQESLGANPANYSQALEVWVDAASVVKKEGLAPEAVIVWDSVPVRVKEELFNLKLTQLAITAKLHGPRVALEALTLLFSLFSRMLTQSLNLGPITTNCPLHRSYAPSVSNGTSLSPTPAITHSRANTNVTTAGGSSQCPPYFGYSFRMYDLQVCLWTTAARLYTAVNLFVDAGLALAEAETLTKGWILVDGKVRGREGLLFQGDSAVLEERDSQGVIPLPTKKVSLLKKKPAVTSAPVGGVDVSKRWGVADASLRRVLADVCYGNALLKEAKYFEALETEKGIESSFQKYLPVSEADKTTRTSSIARRSSFHSTFTINHSYSGSSIPKSRRKRKPLSRIVHHVSPKLPSIPDDPPVTIDMIIDDLHICLALDDHHVPSRVTLAKMYQIKSAETLAEAEFWFERTCKHGKLRGSGGVECWAGLGSVMRETVESGEGGVVDVARLEAARECLYFAVEKDRTAAVRGLQCLGRLCE